VKSAIKPILASVTPTDGAWIAVQATVSGAFMSMVSTNIAVKWMVAGIMVHFGLMAILLFRSTGPTIRQFTEELVTNVVSLGMVVWLCRQAELQFDIGGYTVGPGIFLAAYFGLTNWTKASIMSSDLGVPWPPPIQKMLDNAKDKMDHATLTNSILSERLSVTQSPDGRTTTAQKTTTVVTEKPQ
jgi:hypothetical protein